MNRFSLIASLLFAGWGPINLSAQITSDLTAPCDFVIASGVLEQVVPSGGVERSYRLFVPQSYDGRTRLPLVLDMHGSGGTAAGQAATSRFEALASREGIIIATLQAEGNRWNVPVTEGRADDVAYVSDVIDHVAARVCTDLSRIYATGFSGGARMSSLLGCRLNSRIAAIAPMAGLRWPGPCQGRPIPVLTLHGLADPQNPYEGRVPGRNGEWIESVPEALAGWAVHNGCRLEPDLEDSPTVSPITLLIHRECREGTEVRMIRIEGLGHSWAREEIDATEAMWEFFRNHSLPR